MSSCLDTHTTTQNTVKSLPDITFFQKMRPCKSQTCNCPVILLQRRCLNQPRYFNIFLCPGLKCLGTCCQNGHTDPHSAPLAEFDFTHDFIPYFMVSKPRSSASRPYLSADNNCMAESLSEIQAGR